MRRDGLRRDRLRPDASAGGRTCQRFGEETPGRRNRIASDGATHPYAQSITKSIARACRETGTLRWRLLRGASGVSPEHTYVETVSDAAAFLSETEGNILLTTGSKELAGFSQLPGFSERVWARVLPLQSSLDACAQAGLPASHIFAMQGPFSEAMNAAMLRTIGAQYLVTKDGGAPGLRKRNPPPKARAHVWS